MRSTRLLAAPLFALALAACSDGAPTPPIPPPSAPPPAASGGASDAGPGVAADAGADAAPVDLGPTFVIAPADLRQDDPNRPAGQSPFYALSLDPTAPAGGAPSALLASTEGATAKTWAASTASLRVEEALWQKRYRVRAKVRVEDAGQAFLWFRIDAGLGYVLDNMGAPAGRRLSGTSSDWSEIQLVLDVPDGARNVSVGTGLVGTGKVWVSSITVEGVGRDVPVTPHYSNLPP
jgi:hypothetical protein